MSHSDEIKKIIQEILKVLGFSGEVEINLHQNKTIMANIKTSEAGLLIGPGGQYLLALQHLVRLLLRKKTKTVVPLVLDINEYRLHRLALLEEMAKAIGQQAGAEQRPIALAPMSSFERRIVHLVVREIPGVVSESQGEGERRHVVVKPKSHNV